MLLSNSTHVTFRANKYMKILYCYAAYDNTFVLMVMPGLARDMLIHVNSQGQELFKYEFPNLMDAFGMLSNDSAILVDTRKNHIIQLNLRTYTFNYVPHQFKFQESDQTDIETFSDTKTFCVLEKGQYQDNHFKLTYYRESEEKPVNCFESVENQWTYEYLVKKANNHSMICWFKPRHDDNFEFRTYDWRDNPDGKFNIYTIKNEMGIPYNLNRIQVAVNTMWQTKKNTFCLVCISNKTDLELVNPKAGVVINNFIIDTNEGKAQSVREANFWFDKKYNDYLIDCHYMGNTSMFRTFMFENSKVCPSPVYYVNNENETIMAEELWECSYLHKYFFPGYDGSMIFDCRFENGDCSDFTLTAKRIINPKEIVSHFMLQLNPKFDQDLMQQVVEIIDYSK